LFDSLFCLVNQMKCLTRTSMFENCERTIK
jgi:hypothetical protein